MFVGCIVDTVTLGRLVGKGCDGGLPPVSRVVLIDPVVSGRLPVALVAVGVCVVGRSVDVTVCRLRLSSANVMAEVFLFEFGPFVSTAGVRSGAVASGVALIVGTDGASAS